MFSYFSAKIKRCNWKKFLIICDNHTDVVNIKNHLESEKIAYDFVLHLSNYGNTDGK